MKSEWYFEKVNLMRQGKRSQEKSVLTANFHEPNWVHRFIFPH